MKRTSEGLYRNWFNTRLLAALAVVGLGWGFATTSSAQLPVTSGLQCWFDAAQGVTTSGSAVTQWDDQSGNGHTATKVNGTMTLAGSQVNGKPVVQFRSRGNASLAGSLFTKQQYVVLRMPGSGDWGTVLGSQSRSGYLLNNGGYMWNGNYPDGVSQNATALTQSSNYQLSNIGNYMVVKIQGNSSDASVRTGWALGVQEGWNGCDMDVAEIVAYNRVLSTGEENLIGGYLTVKYGLTAYPALNLMMRLDSPFDGQAYPSGTAVTASATVVSPLGTSPYTVKFYANTAGGGLVQAGSDQVGAGPTFTQSLGTPADGAYQVYATVTDSASPAPFNATSATDSFTVAPGAATTTTLVSPANPSTYGQSVTFTATVSPAPNGGTVQFYTNGVALGAPVAVNTGTGQAQASTTLLPVSTTHQITAVFSAYGVYLTSTSATLTQTVNRALLTETADNKVRAPGGANPAFTYQITGYQNGENATSAGVTGAPILGTAADISSPVGNYSITNTVGTLAAANYSFTAVAGNLAIVAGAPPAVSTGNMSCWFEASMGVTANGSAVTSWNDQSGNGHNTSGGGGTVTLAANQLVGRPAIQFRGSWLNIPRAMYTKEQYLVLRSPTVNWTGAGTMLGPCNSSFNGDGNYRIYDMYQNASGTLSNGFWTDPAPAGVSKNGTVVALQPGNNFGFPLHTINEYFILRINVGARVPAYVSVPTNYQIGRSADVGTVNFDVAEILAYDTPLSAADEALVGGYLAQKYWIASAYPLTYLAVKLNSPFANQGYTYGSDVPAVAQVAEPNGALTDTVTFYTKLLPSGPLVAWLSTQDGALFTADLGTSLAAGAYEIYATVSNNDSPAPGTATSATNTFTVAAPTGTSITLASTLNPSTYGQAVTFTATVTPTPSGGTVQFYANAVALGSPMAVDTATGQATVTNSLLAAGSNRITATYSGFGIYLGSTTASPLTQTVDQAVLTVTAYSKVRSPGTANPPFTYYVTGYQNSEDAVSAGVAGGPVLGTVATPASPLGTYEITNAVGTLTAPNYSFTTVDGTLKVMVGALPSVAGEVVCWYDAGAGVTTDGSGVYTWDDQSPNGHLATRASGSPQLALSDVNGKPAVQLRGSSCYLNCAGGMFTKEQYVVARSPNPTWSGGGSGCFLGRLGAFYTVRDSSYSLYSGYTGFWDDQLPAAVSKNGTPVSSSKGTMPRGGFELGSITDYMILKITENNNALATNITQYPYWQIGKMETLSSCDMDIAEIIGYNSALSTDDEAQVGSFLAAKYNLSTAYPAAPTTPTATLTITPDGFGNFTISGTVSPAQATVHLWKCNDLSLGAAGWTDTGDNADASTGTFTFFPPRSPATDGPTQTFYLVK